MITKRIIPCLDVKNGRVVKGVRFRDLRDVADPAEMAALYNEAGADELVFYDITASTQGRKLFIDALRRVAGQVFIPLTVGGGIRDTADFSRVLEAGADKISVNSGAIDDPGLIDRAARKFGSQCVVLSIDVKRVGGTFRVFSKGGRQDTGKDAVEWAAEGADRGAGELVVNSMDTDGVMRGFDLDMLDCIAARVKLPIVASGGAGCTEDFIELFRHPGIDAGLAATIFHYEQVKIPELKKVLATAGIPVRQAEGAIWS
ncbi:MAG: imidazole glycerol phosphate synthase subunit HisF [Christensenellales bacterium]|jgi:cyclase